MPSQTFSYTGGEQTFAVPANLIGGTITVDMYGAEGGDGSANVGQGGQGGRCQCTLAVTPGENLAVIVGGMGGNASGQSPGGGGYGGGGTGGYGQGNLSAAGGGGGGRSAIRRGSTELATAGGGGGGGSRAAQCTGGAGGGSTGANGTANSGTTANGKGGTAVAGGAGGTGGGVADGSAGSNLAGGTGGGNVGSHFLGYPGGGGGGGWYGGGGGACGDPNGGGGGGSGMTGTLTQGGRSGNGVVTITWTANTTPSTPTNVQRTSAPRVATPTFSATVTDPDGGTVRARFFVNNDADTVTIGELYTGYVASGSTASGTWPHAPLAPGTYTLYARASDPNGAESVSAPAGGLKFTIPPAGSHMIV